MHHRGNRDESQWLGMGRFLVRSGPGPGVLVISGSVRVDAFGADLVTAAIEIGTSGLIGLRHDYRFFVLS